ncbi:pseudouridylate synthase TRUB2, mitochondrial isoform X1 [Pelodiscus sinensis]|uniref:pseudouridylate synthase TRUB2, mitochondrial isoform X1 n=2 Tax=Pelodiscus sinensis TaxID=13735 RepID=UPI0003C45DE8|nr:mitochondrial mRNA pseudouridine synthase TRUB2 isoform X1 [Pelodiscus sinensis]XP_014426984.1 mitochondrial mRNA pseudouridine synthase TRUB2 isoform X2 [Pelodiscus sinensis]|eukprot:XP_014426983.2 mitochondrial mRNA pseudouridine synthase TRUB2 isoform X1 [Pelodiscus sinensis]
MAVRKAAWSGLNGLFTVYKPSGVASLRVRDSVETLLLKELNSLKQPDMPQQVRFLPTTVEGNAGKELTLTVTQLPVLAAHPLVRGPNFTHLKIGVGHRLDTKSSGVLVLGVGHGNKLLTDLYDAHLTRTYTVRGLFGKATDDFSDTGKLIEKTTFDHVTRDKLERILAVIQGTNHKALLMYSKIDLKTQEAYELAVEGLIRPMEKTPPLITAIRCLQFAPPEFQLEIQCLHETQKYLRKVVHEIGLELKSTAVCTQVRRIRDGFFTLDSALLRTHWNLRNIRKSIQDSRIKVQVELQRNLGHQAKSGERHTNMDQVTESELHRTEGISASNISPYAD